MLAVYGWMVVPQSAHLPITSSKSMNSLAANAIFQCECMCDDADDAARTPPRYHRNEIKRNEVCYIYHTIYIVEIRASVYTNSQIHKLIK